MVAMYREVHHLLRFDLRSHPREESCKLAGLHGWIVGLLMDANHPCMLRVRPTSLVKNFGPLAAIKSPFIVVEFPELSAAGPM